MELLIAILLVIDILLRIVFWFYGTPTLSSLEYQLTEEKTMDEIIKSTKKFLDECSEDIRRIIFEESEKYRDRDNEAKNEETDSETN
jgi:hypothetical protein